jgi:phenylpropionate dioxygenase-like ring-hydroxylating dioxygenase large terminal subunit
MPGARRRGHRREFVPMSIMNTQAPPLAPHIPQGLPGGLRSYWYPVLQSEELPADRPVGFMALSEPLVAWRDAAGRPHVVRDRCPHRSVKLSIGRVLDGDLQCALHGLRFDGTGRCTLIPWQIENPKVQDMVRVQAYPAEELGGYVWAYIGDAAAFPPPPLAGEVPEELSKPDEFIWFRLPTQVWNANWLLAIDGSDGFHAVTLHAGSQAVKDQKWTGGRAAESAVPLEDRRVKIVKTSHGLRGISVDLAGKQIAHGHFTVDVKGDRFTLPCIHTNPIVPAPGAAPYAARLWQFPIDETRCQIVRFVSWRARTAEERARAEKVFRDVALPRLEKVAAEDQVAAEAQGDVVAARSQEFLFAADEDVVGVRRLIAKAFLSGANGERIAIGAGALVYPL